MKSSSVSNDVDELTRLFSKTVEELEAGTAHLSCHVLSGALATRH